MYLINEDVISIREGILKMTTRNLELSVDHFGWHVAEFNKFYNGEVYRARRCLAQREYEKIASHLGDEEIEEHFCHSIG
jgi:hypothetical protein